MYGHGPMYCHRVKLLNCLNLISDVNYITNRQIYNGLFYLIFKTLRIMIIRGNTII